MAGVRVTLVSTPVTIGIFSRQGGMDAEEMIWYRSGIDRASQRVSSAISWNGYPARFVISNSKLVSIAFFEFLISSTSQLAHRNLLFAKVTS